MSSETGAASTSKSRDLIRSPLSPLLLLGSRIPKVRRVCFWLAKKLERGTFHSFTAREIMRQRYGISIGAYSYGECFVPGAFPPRVRIGRYVSIASGISILRRNHPLDRISTHPFFFNHILGFVKKDTMEFTPLVIEHDAWIGERAIITPLCSRIGIGAIVAAGAVVTKDVPDFAVVGGNPARIIKYRFSEEVRERVLASRWWEKPVSELAGQIDMMNKPAESIFIQDTQHPASIHHEAKR